MHFWYLTLIIILFCTLQIFFRDCSDRICLLQVCFEIFYLLSESCDLQIVLLSLTQCYLRPISIICGIVGDYCYDNFFLNVLPTFVNSLCFYPHCRDAWDMAAELCLSQLPSLVEDPNSEFQVSGLFFCNNSDVKFFLKLNIK